MLTLYYSPGACSLASHIALHEAGEKFDLVKVNLKTHALEDGRSFKDINPKGYVPALQFDNGDVLTENVAILTKIADRHPTLAAPANTESIACSKCWRLSRARFTNPSSLCSAPTQLRKKNKLRRTR